jgi:hypothetical protein
LFVSDSNYHIVELNLLNKIDFENSVYELFRSKIEIKFKKYENDGIWSSLEKNITNKIISQKPSYPSSAKQKKNWDKIEMEIEKELSENCSMNEKWQNIWKESDETTKYAIEKSMTESGGTVLNMNWDDVRDKKIEPYNGYNK